MRRIVTDERRRTGPKSARRGAVAMRGPLNSVASLAGATSLLRAAPCQRASHRNHGDPDWSESALVSLPKGTRRLGLQKNQCVPRLFAQNQAIARGRSDDGFDKYSQA